MSIANDLTERMLDLTDRIAAVELAMEELQEGLSSLEDKLELLLGE